MMPRSVHQKRNFSFTRAFGRACLLLCGDTVQIHKHSCQQLLTSMCVLVWICADDKKPARGIAERRTRRGSRVKPRPEDRGDQMPKGRWLHRVLMGSVIPTVVVGAPAALA